MLPLLLVSAVLAQTAASSPSFAEVPLQGRWRFALDPDDDGLREAWFGKRLPGHVILPGSLDEQEIGEPATEPEMSRLTRMHRYVGPAWYQREIEVPDTWAGQRVELFLERAHWETRVWIDGHAVGMRNSLSVPHVYDLTPYVSPGTHRLTIRIDNTVKINIGHSYGGWMWAHAVTDETQTNWNGVIGALRLRTTPKVWVKAAHAYTDLDKKSVEVRVTLGNATDTDQGGVVRVCARREGHQIGPFEAPFAANAPAAAVTVSLPLDAEARLWDEFSPDLYTLEVTCVTEDGARHTCEVVTGFREFTAEGRRFLLNGRAVYLRGNLECCIFPLTGYPPMGEAGWRKVYQALRDHGMNHLRFHSWCPPEAAFRVADAMGFMLQVEPPLWDGYGNIGGDTVRANFIASETERIVDTYGNHPSFCLMSMGNELGEGKEHYLQYLVERLRDHDPRHLYTCTTHPIVLERNDDYFDGAAAEGGFLRGLGGITPEKGTDFDYQAGMTGIERPTIAHEVGQYASFPDFDQVAKYTGHLKAQYLDLFRERFEENHPVDLSEAFARASGEFAGLLYKEEIEAQLRTPGLSGFQLLGLQDFPGQGVATIGLLDAFWDDKGIMDPASFRSFCGPTVVLARMPKRIWRPFETFTSTFEVRHHGPADLSATVWDWCLADRNGTELGRGQLGPVDIPTGVTTPLGGIEVPLEPIDRPRELRLSVRQGEISNGWRSWVYPEHQGLGPAEEALEVTRWDPVAEEALAKGCTVLLMAEPGILSNAIRTRFRPVAWSKQLFAPQPSTMGILVDEEHPLFGGFPTARYADWQWFDLLESAEALNLQGMPDDLRPIVYGIDDFNTCRRLGVLLEAKVDRGRLMICTLNLRDRGNSPARQAFCAALRDYVASDSFQPRAALRLADLRALLEPSAKQFAAGPEDTESAALHVRAATKTNMSRSAPWSADLDNVVVLDQGFDYAVHGEAWRDGQGSAWHGPSLGIDVSCPSGYSGTLYVHFHDWNSAGRVARVFVNGRDMGSLANYDGEGVWLQFPVGEDQTRQGMVELRCHTEGGPNVMVTEIVLLPKQVDRADSTTGRPRPVRC